MVMEVKALAFNQHSLFHESPKHIGSVCASQPASLGSNPAFQRTILEFLDVAELFDSSTLVRVSGQ